MEGEVEGENFSQPQAQALQDKIAALRKQLAIQNNAIQQLLTQRSTPTPATPTFLQGVSLKMQISQDRKKPILPKLQEFDGKRSEWNQWYQQAKMKLEVNGVVIRDRY